MRRPYPYRRRDGISSRSEVGFNLFGLLVRDKVIGEIRLKNSKMIDGDLAETPLQSNRLTGL